ncbi:MAG: TIGR03915 family putative DNA repair protein [Clostridia bacterium]|nr:TIGR03915 family putative DNA repair protein [Clostridia bacterium]
MLNRSDVTYIYDGTFNGLLTCIFESFEKHETPFNIAPADSPVGFLISPKEIKTDEIKAQRVVKGIISHMGGRGMEMVEDGYYTCLPDKELVILDFVKMGMRLGECVCDMLAVPIVSTLQKAITHFHREKHLLTGFIRFSEHNGVLVSKIDPKNRVLPKMAQHFCDRYRNETFFIYDATHKEGLLYNNSKAYIIPIDDYIQPDADESELQARDLWKLFYDTIAIKERYNPVCRMSHLPMRYRHNMTEFTHIQENKMLS